MRTTRLPAAWLWLACVAPCLGQAPAPPTASLGAPKPGRVRASAPADEDDRRAPPPAASIGPIQATSGRTGVGVLAEELSAEERYNSGVVSEPAPRPYREPDRDRDRDREKKVPARPASRRSADDDVPPPPRYDFDEADEPKRKRKGESTRSAFSGLLDRLRGRDDGKDPGDAAGGGLLGSFHESDHRLDGLVSPLANPFLAEDPRSLTELRPIYIRQKFRDGSFQQFVLQGRIAVTDCWSLVIHKLGVSILDPGDGQPGAQRSTSFSEIWLGPKWSFYRNEQTQTAAAIGLIFQIPVGGSGAYQDTGSLGLVPYVAYGTTLGGGEYGTFSLMNTLGYAFAVSRDRSSFLYDSVQVDFDVLNKHFFHPLVGLNWFHYTSDGRARPGLGFEGADLANTGAAVKGSDYFSLDVGARLKFRESFQVGGFAEFPLSGDRVFDGFRFGFDAIWRY